MGWPLAIGSMIVGAYANKMRSDEIKRVADKRRDTAVAGMLERQAKANREINPLFKTAIEDVSSEKEKELFTIEDAKNLQNIQQTKSRLSPTLSKGLQIGGKKSGRFSKLQSDRLRKSKSKQDLADIAFSRYLSPVGVQTIRGQAPVELGLGRAKTADEIRGDKLINDIRVSEINPSSGVLGMADALRAISFMASIYNVGSSFGADAIASDPNALQTASPDLTGFSSNVYSTAPWWEQAVSAVTPSFMGDIGSSSTASSSLFNPTSSLLPVNTTEMQPWWGMDKYWNQLGGANTVPFANKGNRFINRFGGGQTPAYGF